MDGFVQQGSTLVNKHLTIVGWASVCFHFNQYLTNSGLQTEYLIEVQFMNIENIILLTVLQVGSHLGSLP